MKKVRRSAGQSVVRIHDWARFGGVALLCMSVNVYAVPAVDALPGGGNISAGNGTISSQGNQMLINQASDKLAINWSSYNIGANASVTYQQPSRQSVALNRVFSADPSQLYGRLNANGSVILINPNGIVVGPGANINVGAMILSTLNLSDSDFLSNNYHFSTPSADSLDVSLPQIINQGNIASGAGGYVHLIGHNIQNQGTINVPGGTVGLLAGDTVSLDLSSSGMLIPTSITTAANADALINNSGTISADQGAIQLSAVNAGISGNDINLNPMANTIVIEQSGNLNSAGGSILIDGGTTGIVQHRGLLNTENSDGLGGNISVLGDEVGLLANSDINASGSQGGGTILVGGNWQGQGPEHNASAVYMDPLAIIKADAIDHGNGGQVVLWSNNYTGFYGDISAKGGLNGGDGGQVETSAQNNLQVMGNVDVSTVSGQRGSWLLDPVNVTIGTTTSGTTFVGTPNPYTYTPTANSSILATSVSTALNAGDVTINTSGGSGGSGDIAVNANITGSAGALTLNAVRNITMATGVTINLTGAGKGINLNAKATGGTAGYISLTNNTLSTNNGDIVLSANATNGASAGIYGAGIQMAGSTLNAGTGNITITGIGTNGDNGSGGYSAGTAGAAGIVLSGTNSLTATVLSMNGTGGNGGVGGTGSSNGGCECYAQAGGNGGAGGNGISLSNNSTLNAVTVNLIGIAGSGGGGGTSGYTQYAGGTGNPGGTGGAGGIGILSNNTTIINNATTVNLTGTGGVGGYGGYGQPPADYNHRYLHK